MADLYLSMDQDIGQLLENATTAAFRVFVTKVPVEINKDGLSNIFGKCGQVIDVSIPVGRNVASPFKTAFVTFPTRKEAQEAVENITNRPPFFMEVNHAFTQEERAAHKLESRRQLENGADFALKLDEFHKTKGKTETELGVKNRKLAEAALSHAIPRLAGGVKGLPANHQSNVNMSGYSSGGEDDWMQIQGFIRVNPVSKEEFDLRPFFFNHPMVLPYAPMELCSYCGKDGLVRCSRCRIWYCGETCQKNHWPKHKLECRPPPPLEKRDGSHYKPPSRSLRQPVMTEEDQNEVVAKKEDLTKPEELSKVTKEEPKVETKTVIDKEKEEQIRKLREELAKSPTIEVQTVDVKKVAEKQINDVKPQEKQILPTVEVKAPEAKKVVEKQINDKEPTKIQIAKESPAKIEKKEVVVKVEKKDVKKSPTSKTVTFFPQSTLQRYKVGDKLEVAIDEISDASKISGMILETEDFDTLYKMAEEVEKIETYKKGDFVVLLHGEDYLRALITDITDTHVIGVEIDWPKTVTVTKDKVYGMPGSVSNIMAAGIVGLGLGSIPKTLTNMLQTILKKDGVIEAQVTEIIQKTNSLRVTFYESKGKALLDYILHPWYKFGREIPTLIGLERSRIMLKDLDTNPLKVKDEVIHVEFHSSYQLIVWLKKDVDQEELLTKELEMEGPKQSKVQDPAKGELVVCQWSEDDAYYRAVVSEFNKAEKKVKVRFVDYGNQSVEPLDRIRELPYTVVKYPIMAKLLTLYGVPEHPLKDVGVNNRLKQLEPLFQSPLTITKEEKKENGNAAFIVEHANGKTVNDIIKAKLQEKSDTQIPPTIQGAEMDGQFSYDKAHVCELKISNEEQMAFSMFANSPQRLFFCPANQIGIAETMANQVENYAKIDETMTGYGPGIGKLCLAKSNDDGSWYRGACLGHPDTQTFSIFFVDYGFTEDLPRSNLKIMDPVMLETPFLANHCILEGFEDNDKEPEYTKDFGNIVEERMEAFSEHKITVVKKVGDAYVVRVPALKDLQPKPSKSAEETKPKIEEPKTVIDKEKEEQIRKLREELAKLGAV